MTPEQFAYWLQGFVELHQKAPTEAQWKGVKEHLAQVFTKVTPEVGNESVKRAELKKIIEKMQADEPKRYCAPGRLC